MRLKNNNNTEDFLIATGIGRAEADQKISAYWSVKEDLWDTDFGEISEFLEENMLYELAEEFMRISPKDIDIHAMAMMVEQLDVE